MSPEEASTLALLADVPDEYGDIRDDLLESLSGKARTIGEILITPPQKRQRFDNEPLKQDAERFESWLAPESELEG